MVGHDVLLRGARFAPADSEALRPAILQLAQQDFVAHLLGELGDREGGHERLRGATARARRANGTLRLFQPVHRTFHMAVLEASCLVPGSPRLDPRRIREAGLVVRRAAGRGQVEGWMRQQGTAIGWRTLPAGATAPGSPYDPDPAMRRTRRLGHNASVLARLPVPTGEEDQAEATSPLFVAPPEICEAFGRTFLYGYVPLASTERVENAPDAAPPFGRDDIRARMPTLLQAGGDSRADLPPVATTLYRTALSGAGAQRFLATLDYLALEAGLFTGDAAAAPLRDLLKAMPLEGTADGGNLYDLLERAYGILVERREDLPVSVQLPDRWPPVAGTIPVRGRVREASLVEAIHAAMTARWNALAPATARYGEDGARYVLSAFLRVEDDPRCPPRTVWSLPSEPFEIVPWYESGDQPPVQVDLPAMDRDAMAKLKPNVAFKVPPEIQTFMEKLNLSKLLDGKAEKGRVGFGMICGFSIPIITLCAFIVLQIFLSLLHILFWWLPFVRICIPFPKPPSPPAGGQP